jgi:hypothetical protein
MEREGDMFVVRLPCRRVEFVVTNGKGEQCAQGGELSTQGGEVLWRRG